MIATVREFSVFAPLFILRIVVPLFCVVIGVTDGIQEYRFFSTSKNIQGQISELVKFSSSEVVVTPRFSFVVDGIKYERKNIYGSDQDTYKVGDSILVSYDPNNPANSRIDDHRLKYFAFYMFLILAFGSFLISMRLARVAKKTTKLAS